MKRFLALLMAVVLVLSATPFAFAETTEEANVQLVVEADKAAAAPGEEVVLTVKVLNPAGTSIHSIGFTLDIPETLVFKSETLTSASKFTQANYNETASNFAAYGATAAITDTEWVVMQATYTVAENAAGNASVNVQEDDLLSVGDANDAPIDVTIGAPAKLSFGGYEAEINGVAYATLEEAIAAATVGKYPNEVEETTHIKLLADVESGFDVGVEAYPLNEKFGTQNISLDLNGHTLTVGHPMVGSGNTEDNGIRVLAFSQMSIKNGTIACRDDILDNVINNYGRLILTNVEVQSGEATVQTIKNRGSLRLNGTTSVANGSECAILNITYQHEEEHQIPVILAFEEDTIEVGKIIMDLNEYPHPTLGDVNKANLVLTITAGHVESIETVGNTKIVQNGVSGGVFDKPIPENVVYDGFEPVENEDGTYGVAALYEAEIDGTKYATLVEAVDAATTGKYPNEVATATTIKLLRDVKSGFDVGVEKYPLETNFGTQNIVLNLNGKTLTLGHPPVGSTGTETNGIRVLAFSQLVVKNGTIDTTGTGVKRVIQNYGKTAVENVTFVNGENVLDTIGNFGTLTLEGEVVVPNGSNSAILNSTYMHEEENQIPAVLNIAENTVEVGKIVVDLTEYAHPTLGDVNKSNPSINISAGAIESIATTVNKDDADATGNTKTVENGVSGGIFSKAVPAELCANGYAPVENEDGTFGVAVAYEAEINGTKYATLEAAVDAATTGKYPNEVAEATTIKLLKDVSSGFDVGVEKYPLETNFGTQNIVLDLDGHTLTLGDPLVGSTGTQTNGIRVLAFSQLVIKNGTIDTTGTGVKRPLQNYGKTVVSNVTFINGDKVLDTIGNFGTLTLEGEVVVPNGSDSAILNSTYMHEEENQIPVVLNIAQDSIEVGKVVVDLTEYAHPTLGDVNETNPVINIEAGVIESIETVVYKDDEDATGNTKTVENGVSGGIFSKAVPAELLAEGFVSIELEEGKYTVETANYEAEVNGTKYETLAEAVAAATTGKYPNEVATATTIKLLQNVKSGFDIGVEKYPLETNFGTQNIVLDLNGKTLTLGYPPVGSTGTQTNGIRVLAFSQLVVKNGTIDTTGTGVKRVIQNYGKATVENVTFVNGENVLDTIGNFGTLNLVGNVVVPNGSNSAILNSTYMHEEENQIPAILNIGENTVKVGKIVVDLNEYEHPDLHVINKANPVINITAGVIESIATTGETKTIVNGVSGGTFTKDPTACLKEGYVASSTGSAYTVSKQATKVEVEVEDVVVKNEQNEDVTIKVEAAVGANQTQGSVDVDIKVEEGEDIVEKTEEVKQALVENNVTASTVQAAVSSNEKTEEHLESVANDVAKEVVTEDMVVEAVEALIDAHVDLTVDDVSEVRIEVKPYLEVAVKNYGETKTENNDGTSTTNQVLTMHIEAKYDVVATVDNGTKSAVLSTGNTMENVKQTISITVPLPKSFLNADQVNVRHYKTDAKGNVTDTFIYIATVDKNAMTATFENPNGFSVFELYTSETKLEAEEYIEDTGRTLSLEGVIYINQYVKIHGFEGVDPATNGGLLIWTSPVTDDNATFENAESVVAGLIKVDDEYAQQTHGIAAKKYADKLYLRVYLKLADGTYAYSTLKEYSVREYCETIIARDSADANLKKACVDMLHYGSAAQAYFDYNTADLANKNIAETHPATAWNENLLTPVTSFTTDITASSNVLDNGKTLSLDGAVATNYYFKVNGITVEDAELLVWDGTTEKLTVDNVSYTKDMVAGNGEYGGQSEPFAAKEYSKTIFVCAHFVDSEGNNHYSEVIAFSPEAYAKSRIENSTNDKMVALMKQMVMYGESASIYFANK